MQGYTWHVASAAGEWTSALALVAYLLSYSRDLEKLRARVHADLLVAHLDDSPVGTPARERLLIEADHNSLTASS